MTNGKCIYCKKVDYKSRMALEKDDFRRFTVICEFVLQEIGSTGNIVSRLEMGL